MTDIVMPNGHRHYYMPHLLRSGGKWRVQRNGSSYALYQVACMWAHRKNGGR